MKRAFEDIFPRLFPGGEAKMWQTNPESLSETGIEIAVQPPGKKMTALAALSGGERAMTAAALIFALIEVRPSPFYLLDEVDAALDDANVDRFSTIVRELAERAQLVLVTHNKKTMELADRLYGVTMAEPGRRAASSASTFRPAETSRRRRLPDSPAPVPGAALFSVYDRTGVVELARDLAARGVAIYATGGTARILREHGVDARDVGELTGFPPLFDGRVKTLHPKIFGGILADRANAGSPRARPRVTASSAISTVVVNLYPFEATVAAEGATLKRRSSRSTSAASR